MEDFGVRLKGLRAISKLSQEDMAKAIGVHVTHLSRYERSLSMPSLEVAEKIASTLDISLDELVYGDKGKMAEDSIDDRELLSLFNKTQKLSDQSKQTVKDLLSAFLLKKDLQQELAR